MHCPWRWGRATGDERENVDGGSIENERKDGNRRKEEKKLYRE